MATFGANFIIIDCSWTKLKTVLAAKSLPLQYDDPPGAYELFCTDSQIVYTARIYTGSVPQGPITQELNDADKANFEASYKPSANARLSPPMTAVGLPSFTKQNIKDDRLSYRKSWPIECAAQVITLRDICVSNDLLGPTGVCEVVGSEFGCATAAEWGSEMQVDLIDRDDVLGYFQYIGASRSRLANLTGITGTFQAGEQIRSATCRSKVLSVGSDFLEITFDRWNALGKPANFANSEVITGQTSGATATLGTPAFTEGGFLFVQRFISDEVLYGFKILSQEPGGAREIPPGMYFRCAVWNNHAITALRIAGAIDIGKK